MSISDLSKLVETDDNLKGLSFEELKRKLEETFYTVYGKYENMSGTMFIEVYHSERKGEDVTKGEVVWKRGVYGEPLIEDEILTRNDAIYKFKNAIKKGYTRVFEAVTQADMDKKNEEHLQKKSKSFQEGLLGIYYKGNKFFKISEFGKDIYYLEEGFDGAVLNAEQSDELGARLALDRKKADGYCRKGEEVEEEIDPLKAFGLELTDEAKQLEKERLANVVEKPPRW